MYGIHISSTLNIPVLRNYCVPFRLFRGARYLETFVLRSSLFNLDESKNDDGGYQGKKLEGSKDDTGGSNSVELLSEEVNDKIFARCGCIKNWK